MRPDSRPRSDEARDYLLALRSFFDQSTPEYRPENVVDLRVEDDLPTIICDGEPGPYTVLIAAHTLGKLDAEIGLDMESVVIASRRSEGPPMYGRVSRDRAREYYQYPTYEQANALLETIDETAVSVGASRTHY